MNVLGMSRAPRRPRSRSALPAAVSQAAAVAARGSIPSLGVPLLVQFESVIQVLISASASVSHRLVLIPLLISCPASSAPDRRNYDRSNGLTHSPCRSSSAFPPRMDCIAEQAALRRSLSRSPERCRSQRRSPHRSECRHCTTVRRTCRCRIDARGSRQKSRRNGRWRSYIDRSSECS